ncbi:SPOR domain-containing protein [Noviherbaspirillum saxi]|uniref:SPOR domain-containing protein n=1 Tax=Noviherbaspirillum saxi TaxID=2320863 RepID=A0A3A3FQ02_9BURK|nr:SPOR domain-containing protein [Noviherbaspirillum saxi]RJF97540.1 SPOR domain-containing protein [Noviherbaspirillum saxi]
MLKFIFWSLVLANGALLAYQQGYFESFVFSGHEPARIKNQLNPDKLKLIPAPDAKPAAAAPAAVISTVATADAAARKAAAVACLEIGNFNVDEARNFTGQLAALTLGERISQRPVQEVATHMVYIPPQADKEAAEKKAGELRRLGVNEFYIIQDNSALRWGISLGVFRMEEAARAHLASMSQKGVRSARIGQRTVTSSMVAFQLRDLDENAKAEVEKIKTGFVKQDIRRCEAA